MNHVFEVPKHPINKNKWNFFNGIFKFKKFISQKIFEEISKIFTVHKKITVHGAVCSQWKSVKG